MAQYYDYVLNDEELLKLQNVLKETLEYIDKFCFENDIKYFLVAGSALGAARHKGFIPWDDDLDIGMMRDDYDRFINLSNKISDEYFLQTNKSEKKYTNFHAKLRVENSIFPQWYSKEYKHRGIQVDIFPFDYIPSKKENAKLWINFVQFVRKVVDLRLNGYNSNESLKRKIAYYILLPLNKGICNRFFDAICRTFNRKKTKNITCHSFCIIRKKRNLIFPINCVLPPTTTIFEGKNFLTVNNPDIYLTIHYGDYMTPPENINKGCHVDGPIIFDIKKQEVTD